MISSSLKSAQQEGGDGGDEVIVAFAALGATEELSRDLPAVAVGLLRHERQEFAQKLGDGAALVKSDRAPRTPDAGGRAPAFGDPEPHPGAGSNRLFPVLVDLRASHGRQKRPGVRQGRRLARPAIFGPGRVQPVEKDLLRPGGAEHFNGTAGHRRHDVRRREEFHPLRFAAYSGEWRLSEDVVGELGECARQRGGVAVAGLREIFRRDVGVDGDCRAVHDEADVGVRVGRAPDFQAAVVWRGCAERLPVLR